MRLRKYAREVGSIARITFMFAVERAREKENDRKVTEARQANPYFHLQRAKQSTDIAFRLRQAEKKKISITSTRDERRWSAS